MKRHLTETDEPMTILSAGETDTGSAEVQERQETGSESRMKESYSEGVAHHADPESCVGHRKVTYEALTGEHAERVFSCEIMPFGVPTSFAQAEGKTEGSVMRKLPEDPAQSQTLFMRGNSLHGNWDTPQPSAKDGRTGRSEKAKGHASDVHGCGESDGCIIPKKLPNKGEDDSLAEVVEGRQPTKGNTIQAATRRTQGRARVSFGLDGVREVARKDKGVRFTALLHHVTAKLLQESFYCLKREAACGVDGMTWSEYEVNFEERLHDLHSRLHRGSYRAQPSRRVHIPKPDGRLRPLGIAALEDKIIQQAVGTVLNAVYEEDFLGFSYGFRPRRGQHDALDALWVGIMREKVDWVLDADIRDFFGTINHEWLVKFIEHRIADRRIIRLIRKWLRAGVCEDGKWSGTEVGTPQGAVISPLLANVYLHYVFDLWVNQWRSRHAEGKVIIVRYADDFVMGFQYRHEADRFLRELKERMSKFGLNLHPDKTRLIEFGRYAHERRAKRGDCRPETFDFLGFTHYCGRKQEDKGFIVKRKTTAKRLRSKLQELKEIVMRRRHEPVRVVGAWLRTVVQGYFNYHAIHGNMAALETFRREVSRYWLHALRRRSQRYRMNWERFKKLENHWIPELKILHPYPSERFYARHPR